MYQPSYLNSADLSLWYGGRYSYCGPCYNITASTSHYHAYVYWLSSGVVTDLARVGSNDIGQHGVPMICWANYCDTFLFWRNRYDDIVRSDNYNDSVLYYLDELMMDLGQDTANAILNDIKSETEETNERLDDIQESLTDSNIDSNISSKLPSDDTNDITEEGIDNIFATIKNAFTSGVPWDLVIPVPFTGKSFTIPANMVQNVLSGTQFSWLYYMIQAFWWYVIGVFIVSDVSKKFTKIKSGDLENIQNDNIKEDML